MPQLSLDPGIADLVRALQGAGFTTTDSGDGVSKPPEQRTFACRHVAIRSGHWRMKTEADSVLRFLRAREGDTWEVQAAYSPNDGEAIILATQSVGRASEPPQETEEKQR